tara:strand:- start:1236 stop:1568 length:333 start_codon:yes stop_codon:yes gene_type:complete
LAALIAASTLWSLPALAAPQVTPQAPPGPTTVAATVPDVEVTAATAESPEETAYLEQVVCRPVGRAASRLPSSRQVCDTRRAWRDMEEEAVRETQRLLNSNASNNRLPGH